MNLPQAGDFIDIHTHGSGPVSGKFMVEILMAHEAVLPGEQNGIAFAAGIGGCGHDLRGVDDGGEWDAL